MKNMVRRAALALAGAAALFLAACADTVNRGEPSYAITVPVVANGSVSAGKQAAMAGETVTLTIRPDAGHELASIRVTPASNTGTIALSGTGGMRAFTMPAEDVTVHASFMVKKSIGKPGEEPADDPGEEPGKEPGEEPADDPGEEPGKEPGEDPGEGPGEELAELYGINIIEADNGAIECSHSRAAAGDTVTLTLLPDEHYRYREGSLSIGHELELTEISDFAPSGKAWTFIMPEEPVCIGAEFEEVPAYTVTVANGTQNGSFTIDREGMAREGEVITITVAPDPGYQFRQFSVLPAGSVNFTPVEDQPAWTFIMADRNIEIGIEFAELGLLEIYKGGARRGISAGELTDDPKYYADCIDMESEEGGRNGNRRAIKITHAAGSGGGTAQQSFGLFSDTEIDLENTVALSFWAKANKSLNIRYAGFGDDGPNRRVVYTGEQNNQSISLTAEWKRFIVPVPAPRNGQTTTRVFLFGAQLSKDNYVCIDDIEFIESGVTLTGIHITDAHNGLFYGATEAAALLAGVPVQLAYTCDDGTNVTLQGSAANHSLKYNVNSWLSPFINIGGNVTFADGIIIPQAPGSAITLTVNMAGAASNQMTARIIDGILLDDFEDLGNTGNLGIPGTPAAGTGYLWSTNGGSPVVVARDFITTAHNEIHGGLHAGSWRPNEANAAKCRGGRNFETIDAAAYTTLAFWIKVTTGGNVDIQRNTVFTFELRNGGTLASKTNGQFFPQQFTYNPENTDGWQEIKMPLSAFADAGLDTGAVTGYAFGVAGDQGAALRIMLDDIAFIR